MRCAHDVSPFRCAVCALLLAALLFPAAAAAVELHDAELVAGGSPVLRNAGGTVRLEDARLGSLGTVVVPEPGALLQIVAGVVLLSGLAVHRRARARSGGCAEEV